MSSFACRSPLSVWCRWAHGTRTSDRVPDQSLVRPHQPSCRRYRRRRASRPVRSNMATPGQSCPGSGHRGQSRPSCAASSRGPFGLACQSRVVCGHRQADGCDPCGKPTRIRAATPMTSRCHLSNCELPIRRNAMTQGVSEHKWWPPGMKGRRASAHCHTGHLSSTEPALGPSRRWLALHSLSFDALSGGQPQITRRNH